MPEAAQALFLKLTKDQREWFPLEGSIREQFEYLQECTETDLEKRRRLAKKQACEEFRAKWEAEHPPEEYIELFRAGLATSGEFRAEVAAELAGEVAARGSMLSEQVRVQVVPVFAGAEGLCERLASDDQLRGEVADQIALDWLGDVQAPQVPVQGSDVQDTTEPVTGPVNDQETGEDAELAELVRMGPSLTQDVQEPAVVPDVAEPVSEAEAPPEMPPVADHVAQAARRLSLVSRSGAPG
jgi:hypothetical protein